MSETQSVLTYALAKVSDGDSLSMSEAEAAVCAVASGDASPVLVTALLTALHMKGETAEEFAGFAFGMRSLSITIEPNVPLLVDTCGTGGGTVPTFNVSTAAAFVVAGAGVAVAKHGNRAMTSRCGRADVLEALGVRVGISPEQVRRCIEEVGIGFLFAQAHHPAMKFVGPIRRVLPFRTIFNGLGPLTNPAGARRQVIGVYEARLAPLLAEALSLLGSEDALVVHGTAGVDEVATFGETLAARVRGSKFELMRLTPAAFGLDEATPDQVGPSDTPAGNAEIIRRVLEGERGPRRDLVLANASAALVLAGAATDFAEGVAVAAESIDSGAARERLARLIEVSSE